MKAVEEISKVTKMLGPQKKILVKTIFENILEFSPLNDVEKELAKYIFSGIVEAVIFASNGGLKPVTEKCSMLSKMVCCK